MARPVKKDEPELLMVSFCDIVTITTAAMFFAMLITVQEAVKIPVIKPMVMARDTKKQAVFFECRGNRLFYIDKTALDAQVTDLMASLSPGVRSGEIGPFLKALQGREIGNQFYKVDPKYLLVGIMALDARPEAQGQSEPSLRTNMGMLQDTLRTLDRRSQYAVFLVRDDSFPVFRRARDVANKMGFETGWELLGLEEPIKFGQGGIPIWAQ